MFSKQLNEKLDEYHLLRHPFYKSWNEGKLTRQIIKDYAEQYYQHVKAFPRYISATHSLCEDIEKRKILLENLQDEENQNKDHPKLWKNFAVAMGAKKEEIDSVKKEKFTKELIDNFFKNGRASYAEGLASLYTYERQIPEIAESNILSSPRDRQNIYDPKPDYLVYALNQIDGSLNQHEYLKILSNPENSLIPENFEVIYFSNKANMTHVIYKINYENDN